MSSANDCGAHVYWWDGEYDDNCIRPEGHDGDHWDGMSWFNDENEPTDDEHGDTHADREVPDDIADAGRLTWLDDATRERLTEKYAKARKTLGEEER